MGKEEDELNELEEQLKELENMEEQDNLSYGAPEPEKKETMFRFFRYILDFYQSWKVGNLKDDEIGKSQISIRSYLDMAKYAEAERLEQVRDYFIEMADIVASPTMGRKGFISQLFVTQIQRKQTIKEPQRQQKKGWFGGGNKNDEGQ